MSTNLQDITLQSSDGVLVARNEAGHLTYPMLFLNRRPIPSDAQGWDRVLVFIDGDANSTVNIHPAAINLNEDNNYFQSLTIQIEGKWSIDGVIDEYIQLESSSGQMEGVGAARIDVTKNPSLTVQGEYSCSFDITFANAEGTAVRIPVYITVNVPLTVNDRQNNETLEITLQASNDYTEVLTILRDREWSVEDVDPGIINVTPVEGNGRNQPDFISTLTVTKSPDLITPTATTTFQIVSLFQRVNVKVNIMTAMTGEFIDPVPPNLYIYI